VGVDLANFAESVGDQTTGPVWVIGQQTRVAAPFGVRQVEAPCGIYDLQPDEMTVVCGAGTPINELQEALSAVGQYVNLPVSSSGSGTVGGALAQGHGDIYRLGRGATRDTLLQVRYVNHDGHVVMAGGPTVKNVSGFDLCRLFVGSFGRLGFMGETILRTRPVPQSSRWFHLEQASTKCVNTVLQWVYRPASVLTNGQDVWFCIEGHPKDCDETITQLSPTLPNIVEVTGPPDLQSFPYRRSMSPAQLSTLFAPEAENTQLIVEAGVGVVHSHLPTPTPIAEAAVTLIHQRILHEFNPTGRLNPGINLISGMTQ
jgi:glycolate oxidase FAD binding subunit